MGIIALLIHSFVDFNLQIPANAGFFTVLLAMGWLARYMPVHKQASRRSKADD
jgi:hypothetical protein